MTLYSTLSGIQYDKSHKTEKTAGVFLRLNNTEPLKKIANMAFDIPLTLNLTKPKYECESRNILY